MLKNPLDVVRDLRAGDPESVMLQLREYFHDKNIVIPSVGELLVLVHTFFSCLGVSVKSETDFTPGRADMFVYAGQYIYLFKFSVDGSAAEAFKQIDNKNYEYLYAVENRKVFKIGMNYRREAHFIDDWRIA